MRKTLLMMPLFRIKKIQKLFRKDRLNFLVGCQDVENCKEYSTCFEISFQFYLNVFRVFPMNKTLI